MRILIAEDDNISRKILQTVLTKDGNDVIAVEDGLKALEWLQKETPDMLITDWMMPDLDGLELCRRVRALNLSGYVYIILLTALTEKKRIIEGLDAGADDYVTKPYDRTELLARVRAGKRVIQLEKSLRQKNKELSEAFAQIKQLKGILPICMHCKKIRKDENYWQQVEEYVAEHSEADFSHSICPECMEKYYPEYVKRKKTREIIVDR
ncbi:MAG: response regulator receiver protein [candidate division Zixibacteria bacterium SM23_73_3]|nr:MAG: response regulator receiver protein [candidate division Zixibacteria bacterium SM23_73_3]